jgi:Ni/Co efflux regulator RcnB
MLRHDFIQYNQKINKAMKKIMLIAAAALFIGATAANAQDPTMDTTKNPRRSTQETQKSSDQMNNKSRTTTQPQEDKMDTESRHQGQTLIRPSEIPASLRQSLQSSDYSGWESGRVYRAKNGEYLVEIKKNGMTKTHRFDASGQPIKE